MGGRPRRAPASPDPDPDPRPRTDVGRVSLQISGLSWNAAIGRAVHIGAPKRGRELVFMPVDFPHVSPEGKPVSVEYFTLEEAALKLHVSRATLREKCRRQQWPHLKVGGRYFMNAEQLARVVEILSVNPDLLASWRDTSAPGVTVLGLVDEDPDEAEGIR